MRLGDKHFTDWRLNIACLSISRGIHVT